MAPRKRTTRQKKNNPKMAKLEAFLGDFDIEVKTRVAQLNEKAIQMLKDIDNAYNMALIKLPKAVRQTNWIEYIKSEKAKSGEVDKEKREEEAAIVNSVVAEDHAVHMKSVKTSKKKGAAISRAGDENTPGTTKKAKPRGRPPTTSKRAKALAVSNQNTSIRRSNRKPLVTPARSMMDCSLMMGPTPLITPRFDPRLPKTPAVRVQRHKEKAYSFSVNGSPIAAGSEGIFINIPTGTGECVKLVASQMDSVDRSLLDEAALSSIRELRNHLTALCGSE